MATRLIYGLVVYCLVSLPGVSAAQVEVANVTYTFADKPTETISVPLVKEGNVQRFRLKASDIPGGVKHVEVLPAFATARTGEDGYFVMPNGYLGTFRQEDGQQLLGRSPMPMFGMKTPRHSFVAIVTGMSHHYQLIARAKSGVYQLFPRFVFDGYGVYEDLAIDYQMLSGSEANYSGMARAYRAFQLDRGACVPLKERIKDSPELAYAAKAVEIRIRLAWKPVPPPVEEQTLENEPEMKVAATFDRVGDILDELRLQGVGEAEICLVGWNRKGHDGRYPQLFPVEEQLGGEEKLKKLIGKAQGMGYQIVAHTNSSDAYRVSELWDEQYLAKTPSRELLKGSCWSGGRMYKICPKCSFERFAVKDLPAVAALGFRGVHYIDVLTISRPHACFDPEHPLNASESAAWVNRIMHLGREQFGAVASEGPFDFCCGNLDYVLYVSFAPYSDTKTDMVDRLVPLWQLVYHGIILSNPFSKTTNYTIKGDLARVKLAEFGGRPLFYFHSAFLSNNKNWMGSKDIGCATDEALVAGVAAVRAGADDYAKRRHLQYEFMEEHQMVAPNVSLTAYSDGSEIIANCSDSNFVYRGKPVGPLSYLLVSPTAKPTAEKNGH